MEIKPQYIFRIRAIGLFACVLAILYIWNQPLIDPLQPPKLGSKKFGVRNPKAITSLLSLGGFEGHMGRARYVESALRLGCSMKKYGLQDAGFDWLLLVVDELRDLPFTERKALEHMGWELVYVRCLPLWNHWSFFQNRYNNACMFSKLWLWSLIKYDTVIYVDLDMLMIGDPTNLTKINALGQIHMIPDKGFINTFNAGLIILSPNVTLFQHIVKESTHDRKHREYAEQTFLSEFFYGAIQPLPINFSLEVGSEIKPGFINDNTMEYRLSNSILIHFIAENKPWNTQRCIEQQILSLCNLWTQTSITCDERLH